MGLRKGFWTGLRAGAMVAFGGAALAGPVAAQGWGMVDTEGGEGSGAYVCAAGAPEACFRLSCAGGAPLHYEIALMGAQGRTMPEQIAAHIAIDGKAAGLLLFAPEEDAGAGMTTLTAPFDPRLHGDLIARLRGGNRAEVSLQLPGGALDMPFSLKGSSRTLRAVLQSCPMPVVPLKDPAAVVLDQIVRECGQIGGTVSVEPGFVRREDLDGDGRKDVVIDYAAAACSKMASLYCGSGGCTVGFFLARDDGFKRIFDGVIRGYSAQPGGRLALDLHGTACGLYGFEACRKVFRIGDDSFALVEELSGAAAEAAMAADRAATAEPPAMAETQEADPDAAAEETPSVADAGSEGAEETPAAQLQAPAAQEEPAAAPAPPPPQVQEIAPAAPPETPPEAPAPPQPMPPVAPPAPAAAEASPPLARGDGAGIGMKTMPALPKMAPQMPAPAPVLPTPPAADTPPPQTPDVPAAPAPAPMPGAVTLEWVGDGASVFVPAEGEQLPADLAPAPAGGDD